MPFCNSCGKKISDVDEFCPICGNELKSKSVRRSPLSDKSSPVPNKLYWLIAVLLVMFFIYILFGRPSPAQPTQNRESIYEQQLALCGNGVCDYGEGIYIDCPQDCSQFFTPFQTEESGAGCMNDDVCPSYINTVKDPSGKTKTTGKCVAGLCQYSHYHIECSGSYQCPSQFPVCISYRCQMSGGCDPHTSGCVLAK